MPLKDIRIVLVEPAHPGNIGAVARAMKTMALSKLVLVRPESFPSQEANRRSLGAIDLLNSARVVDELEDAISDCRLVIGSSARGRSFPHVSLDARQCGVRLWEEAGQGEPVALLFGPERTGLSNQDLDRCAYQVRIPTSEDFSSLNLAAAVQLLCYEVFVASQVSSDGAPAPPNPSERPSLQVELEHFHGHLERALDSRGYLDGEMREVTLTRLRRVFGRARPHSGELKLLHSLMKLIHRDGE